MPLHLLIRLTMLPAVLLRRGPRAYYVGTLALETMALAASVVWLVAPIALWRACGFWWMLLWLAPTCAAVFGAAYVPLSGG